MAIAAFQAGLTPGLVSFKGMLQTMNHFLPFFCAQESPLMIGVKHG